MVTDPGHVEEVTGYKVPVDLSLIKEYRREIVSRPARSGRVRNCARAPRTMDQLTDLLAGANLELSDDVLNGIDRIVPPGVTLNTPDAGWEPPSLTDPSQRRRPAGARAAS
jgi:hypothetical protein